MEGLKINVLGDSITAGSCVANRENRFTERMARMCGAEVRNYGLSGSRITPQQQSDDGHSNYVDRAMQMDPDADLILVFGGTNDYGHGDAPMGQPGDATPETFCGACRVLFEELLTKYPESQIVVMTPLHRLLEDSPRGDNGTRKPADVAPLIEYVNNLKTIAQRYAIPVCDLYSISGLQPSVEAIRTRYIPDGLHPNDAGHAKLTEKLVSFLRAL